MTTEEIHIICEKYNIENYTINEDLSIDVDGYVNLRYKNLNELPLKFRNVRGTFDCSWNNLTTLYGVPNEVGGSFDCSYSHLTSLEGAPNYVDHSFDCHNNNLTSLEGSPSYVGGIFSCLNNPLESIKGITLNLKEYLLYLPDHLSYSDYLVYFRNLKFKKILKC